MMVVKRGYKAVAKLFRGKKSTAVVVRKRRQGRPISKMISVKKTVLADRLSAIGGANLFGHYTFELADVPQYAAYAGLYEEFRIDKVVVKFNSLHNVANATFSASAGIPFVSLGMIHTNIDFNDSTNPTSIQSMMNDSSYKGSRSSKNHTRTLRPMFLNDVASNVQAESKRGWLKTENDNISHYGLKFCLEGGISSTAGLTTYVVEPIITYYISFKNPK